VALLLLDYELWKQVQVGIIGMNIVGTHEAIGQARIGIHARPYHRQTPPASATQPSRPPTDPHALYRPSLGPASDTRETIGEREEEAEEEEEIPTSHYIHIGGVAR
jgi:hypothetical protein